MSVNIFDRLLTATPFGPIEDEIFSHVEDSWKASKPAGFDHENIPFLVRVLTAIIGLKLPSKEDEVTKAFRQEWASDSALRHYCLRSWHFDDFPIKYEKDNDELGRFVEFCKKHEKKKDPRISLKPNETVYDWISNTIYAVTNYNAAPILAPMESTAISETQIGCIERFLTDKVVESDMKG